MKIEDLPQTIIVNKYSGETAVLTLRKGLHSDCLGYYRNTNKSGRKDECYSTDNSIQSSLCETMQYGEEFAVKQLFEKLKQLKFTV